MTKMTPLPSHEAFEAMLRPRRATEDGFLDNYNPWTCVCFTAKWCGPCKRIDKDNLLTLAPVVTWYSCDIDENQNTLGYCGLKSIPSFCLLKDGMLKDRKSGASSVEEVLEWLVSNGVPIQRV